MKASFAFMSSPPTVRKKPRPCAVPPPPPSDVCCPGAAGPVRPPRLLPLYRRGRARGLQLKPPCLQLRRRHPKLSRNTRLRRPRRQKARNRLLLVLRRKPPPRLPRHHIPPDRSVLYQPVRNSGATSRGAV